MPRASRHPTRPRALAPATMREPIAARRLGTWRARGVWGAACAAAVLAAGCASLSGASGETPALPATAAIVIHGEQHDQPDHQRQATEVIRGLALRGELAALVIEMADAGRDTRALAPSANAAAAQQALAWQGWDWNVYEPVVMAAVRAGVPVLGGNLPRARMRQAMADPAWDDRVPPAVREQLARAVDEGHCGLLPATQLPAMVRVQIARDASMAATVAAALREARPGQRVLLLTGAQHASRDRGVPLHLVRHEAVASDAVFVRIYGRPPGLVADESAAAQTVPRPDACEELRRTLPPGVTR